MRSVALESGRFSLLIVFEVFGAVIFDNRLVFSKVLSIMLVNSTGLVIFPIVIQNMGGFLVFILPPKQSFIGVSLLHWLPHLRRFRSGRTVADTRYVQFEDNGL